MNVLLNYFTNTGFLLFIFIKLIGYIALLRALTKYSMQRACFAGICRTLLGLALGITLLEFTKSYHLHFELFYLLITVLRAFEWTLVLYTFYSKWMVVNSLKKIVTVTLASSALDLFAAVGLVSVDGLIC